METRRRFGAILLVTGIAVALLGVVGTLALGPTDGPAAAASPSPPAEATPDTEPTAESSAPPTPRPETTAAPTAVPTTSATTAPTAGPSATVDPEVAIREFFDTLVPAVRAADVSVLVPALHPATIERYGEPACTVYLAGRDDPTFDVEVATVEGPGTWDYVTDDLSTTISDAWTVGGAFTTGRETADRELHVAFVGDEVRWFTDCGVPLAT